MVSPFKVSPDDGDQDKKNGNPITPSQDMDKDKDKDKDKVDKMDERDENSKKTTNRKSKRIRSPNKGFFLQRHLPRREEKLQKSK